MFMIAFNEYYMAVMVADFDHIFQGLLPVFTDVSGNYTDQTGAQSVPIQLLRFRPIVVVKVTN
jgi:hypothetical protein